MPKRKCKRPATIEPNPLRIPLQNPLPKYKELIHRLIQSEETLTDDQIKYNFLKIADEVRDVIWQLVFDEQISHHEVDRVNKITELLQQHRSDCCIYSPWTYNEWLIRVRDELLLRDMFPFWSNVIVKNELGVCCVKDYRLVKNYNDPGPLKYRSEDFLAQFARIPIDESAKTRRDITSFDKEANNVEFSAGIGTIDPLTDYQVLMDRYVRSDSIISDEILYANSRKIARSVHSTVFQLLFKNSEKPPSGLDAAAAAELLVGYKNDAVFYHPWLYNEWIVKLRDKLLECNLLDFWRNVIVKYELGPCWARDSDYFDDLEDPEPAAFYAHADCVAPFAQKEDNEET